MNLTNHYKSIFAYIKANRRICAITLLVIIELVVFSCLNAEPTTSYAEYVSETKGLYGSEFAFIFFENLKSSLIVVLYGTIPLGLLTLFGTYSLCYGMVSAFKMLATTVSLKTILFGITPHGIIEIPAICFSVLLSALWCKALTLAILRLIRRKPVLECFKEDCRFLYRSVILILIPALLVAAIIEVTLSPLLIEMII